jgi:lipopolysaccharide export system ATP-binding protein
MLLIDNLSKKYGQKEVIKSFSMQAKRGEVVALMGPNGAGKTTSFYMIIGIVKQDSGKIFFDDLDIGSLPMYMRARIGIGYLPQEASIFRKMTVEENILCALEIRLKDKKQKMYELEDILNEFHIQHIRKSPGQVLSGGERRRVEVARMLAMKPSFILLDEPFAGVDPIAVQDIKNLIQKLKTKSIGVIITDHNVRETLQTVDKAYILYDSEVICSGTPQEIMKDDKVRSVYLGSNFSI